MPDSSTSSLSSSSHIALPLVELAAVRRSGLIESRHYGSLIAIGSAGNTVLELGPIDDTILPRSTVKPLQALACLTAGAPLEGAELAIAAGSHTGEDEHVRVIRSILARGGLGEDALGCPADWPEDDATRDRLIRAGKLRSPIRMNCSGKHAAMLLACAVNGWSIDDYLDPSHPLQKHVLATVAEMTDTPVSHTAVDGCGAPLFGTTVRGLAIAFRKLVTASPDEAAGRVASAMRAHPFYVGGTGQANTELMRLLPGVLAKGGAEGVIGVAGPNGTAVSMKVIDGSPRATTLIAIRVLEFLGIDTSAAAMLALVPVLGGGVRVGEITVGADLTDVIAAVGSGDRL